MPVLSTAEESKQKLHYVTLRSVIPVVEAN